jgi:hypothetical protein
MVFTYIYMASMQCLIIKKWKGDYPKPTKYYIYDTFNMISFGNQNHTYWSTMSFFEIISYLS